MKKLKYLSIHSSQVNDLSPLAKLKNLEWLTLSSTGVSDLSPLANMEELVFLDLGETKVSNISHLSKMKKLEYLFIKFLLFLFYSTHVSCICHPFQTNVFCPFCTHFFEKG